MGRVKRMCRLTTPHEALRVLDLLAGEIDALFAT